MYQYIIINLYSLSINDRIVFWKGKVRRVSMPVTNKICMLYQNMLYYLINGINYLVSNGICNGSFFACLMFFTAWVNSTIIWLFNPVKVIKTIEQFCYKRKIQIQFHYRVIAKHFLITRRPLYYFNNFLCGAEYVHRKPK